MYMYYSFYLFSYVINKESNIKKINRQQKIKIKKKKSDIDDPDIICGHL